MTNLTLHRPAHNQSLAIPLPAPRIAGGAINVRAAVPGPVDLAFIDALQKKHSKMVGWFPTKQIEKNIDDGHVLIAEAEGTGHEALGTSEVRDPHHSDPSAKCQVPNASPASPSPLGYCISRDKYMKREDCGIVYQLNVMPGEHRKLVGASLIQGVFERAAYGCKLFCCWCAQDIAANHFWESIGFVPLAFRTGSRRGNSGGPRIHIFWQKRIREGDNETPYWFPSETSGGAVRENRVILPIPPGTHWSDAKPAVLPGMEELGRKQLTDGGDEKPQRTPRKKKEKVAAPPARPKRGLWFAPPAPPEPTAEEKKAAKAAAQKENRAKRKAQKNDPKLVAAARDLCARYLEEVQGGRMLPGELTSAKYDVSRLLEAAPSTLKQTPAPHLLKAA